MRVSIRSALTAAAVALAGSLAGCHPAPAPEPAPTPAPATAPSATPAPATGVTIEALPYAPPIAPAATPSAPQASVRPVTPEPATTNKQPLLDLVAEFKEGMRAATVDYANATASFAGSGGINPLTLTSEPALLDRIALAEDCARANAAYRDRVQQLFADQPDKIRALADQGVAQADIDAYLAAFEKDAASRLERLNRARVTDDVIFSRAAELLTILHENYGLWHANDKGEVIFASTVPHDPINHYRETFLELREAATEQARLQRAPIDSRTP